MHKDTDSDTLHESSFSSLYWLSKCKQEHQASKEAFLLYFALCLAFNLSVLHLPSQYKQILSVGMMVLFTLDS